MAESGDVTGIRALLADDELGRQREDLTPEGLVKYQRAFAEIERDPNNELFVAELDGQVVGTFQLTWIPYLSRGGNTRAHIEAVRVASHLRGQGLGTRLMEFALERARQKGCLLAQLTTDKTREQAHRFYQNLGFQWTHFGMKMPLSQGDTSP